MSAGRIWPAEQRIYRDLRTGVTVRQLTDYKGHSHHLYFTNPGWHDGGRRLIFASDRENRTNLFSLDLPSGEILQLTDLAAPVSPRLRPHFQQACLNPAREEVYFCYDGRLMALDLGSLEPKVLWEKYDMPGFMYTPETVQNGCLFGFMYDKREDSWQIADNTEKQTLSLRCFDIKTGKLLWKQTGFRHGVSLAAADGMLYVRDFQTLRLVEANPDRYVEKGRVENLHGLNNKRFSPGLGDWVMPVIANGRLYIRTPLEMICYDLRPGNAATQPTGAHDPDKP